MNGFVILDKSEGMTSFKASSFLRRIYGEKKTGHTGTLDPMATGVLPVALGRATRFIDFLPVTDKGYIARFRFGITTDTLDITGNVLSETQAHVTLDELNAVLPRFRGEIMQTPPMFSAISIDGKRLYELARRGVEVEREQRAVTVYSLEAAKCASDEFLLHIMCSKGTYVRSLIDDIGKIFDVGACMTALRRTYSNGFSLKDAHTEDDLKSIAPDGVLPVDFPFECFDSVTLSSAQTVRFQNGGELFSSRLNKSVAPAMYRVYSNDNVFLGLGEITENAPDIMRVRRVI